MRFHQPPESLVHTSWFNSLCPVIPKVTKHLLSNPVFTCIILAACMEIAVVAGFAAFLGKYLEQQFNLTTTSANQLLGLYSELQTHSDTATHLGTLSSTVLCLFRRYDSYSMCLPGDLHGWFAGEEAEPVSAGSHPHGHVGQPDIYCMLRLLPLPGLRHGSRRRSDGTIPQRVRENSSTWRPCLFTTEYRSDPDILDSDIFYLDWRLCQSR